MIKKWGVMDKQSILQKVRKIQFIFSDRFDRLSQKDKYDYLHLVNIKGVH